ncbi:MAG: hypothetical protein CMA10_05665 [Euryarchaeota archaeon]|nr:hypothetical protein [Euryarchaeota archaeon]|tara:strand:- start:7789 stop:8694 length:906 start_codon:yes stop_codon:yes gene_type:complete
MRDLLETPFFKGSKERLMAQASRIQEASMLHLHAPSSLEGVLALGFLEAACLDAGYKYQRRLYPAKHHRPRDEVLTIESSSSGLGVLILSEEETWDANDLKDDGPVKLVPTSTNVQLGTQNRIHHGALDCVIQASALAACIAPNGRRVRQMRPFSSLGLWMRASLDRTIDPIHTAVVMHLKEEGSIRVVSLPEVKQPEPDMIPGLAERRLKKLHRAWAGMDVEERTQALSELVLPCLVEPTLSTPRLEELIWHRMLSGDEDVDIASQAFAVQRTWPKALSDERLHASKLIDHWIQNGNLLL